MMPAMFAQFFAGNYPQSGLGSGKGDPEDPAAKPPEPGNHLCPDCKQPIADNAKFCPLCGHQQLVFRQCVHCGKNLTPSAKFCSSCGKPAEEKPQAKTCSRCGAENLGDAKFCTQCGEKY
jgi:predicted amidophosphoribosyltransferase